MLVLSALLIPALIALGALSLGVTTLWTAHNDLQRSADLASLAAAANTPTISLDPSAATLPIPLDGLTLTKRFTDIMDPSDWRDRPCIHAKDQFAGERSIVVAAFRTNDESGCVTTWQYESKVLAALGACAADLLDVPDCAAGLKDGLAATLPVISAADPAVTAINDKASSLADRYTERADRVITATVARLLPDGCVRTVQVSPLLPPVCTQTVAQLMEELGLGGIGGLLGGEAGPAVPQIGVNLAGLLPAVLTPRVNVTLDDTVVRPVLSPFEFDMTGDATARRTIKSAVVLPSAGIPGLSDEDAFAMLPARVQNLLNSRLGIQAAELLADAGVDGFVIDPVDLTQALPNPQAVVTDTMALLEELDGTVATTLHDALETTACRFAPASRWCPEITSVVDSNELLGPFVQDVKDVTYQPPPGAQPSLNEMLDYYAETGTPAFFVSGLRRTDLADFFGESVWTVLTDPTVNPVLAPLLSPLMFIPALDVVPATVGRTVISGNPIYTIKSIPMRDTLATRGLYQGRLVK